MSADPINRAMLDGALNELHQLWCDHPSELTDDTADPERAAIFLACAVWELLSEADELTSGAAAAAVNLLAARVAAQYFSSTSAD